MQCDAKITTGCTGCAVTIIDRTPYCSNCALEYDRQNNGEKFSRSAALASLAEFSTDLIHDETIVKHVYRD